MDVVESDEELFSSVSIHSQSRRRRIIIILIVVALLVLVGGILAVVLSLRETSLPSDPLARALAITQKHPLIDSHNDLPWRFRSLTLDNVFGSIDLSIEQNVTMTDIPRIKQGHLGAQFWSVYVGCKYQHKDAVRATQEQIDVVYQMQKRYSDFFRIVRTPAQILQTFYAGMLPSLMGIEGGHQIDSSLGSLRSFARQGVMYMTLTHNCNTPWSESCCDANGTAVPGGLSPFGVSVVEEMNRLGMIVDISHTSVATMKKALQVSKAPVIFSHSNAYALCPTARNVPDDVLLSLKQNDGVIMLSFVPGFVNCTSPSSASLGQVVDHMDYIANLIGYKHIGIGADFDGIEETIPGLQNVSQYPNLVAEMYRRGYTDEQVVAIIGGNIMRVLAQVQSYSASLQSKPVGSATLNNLSVPCRTRYCLEPNVDCIKS